jgi:hypothetical protein
LEQQVLLLQVYLAYYSYYYQKQIKMRISELLEQTIAPVPPGQTKPLPPTAASPNTPTTPPPAGTPPPPPPPAGTTPPANPNTPQVGQPMAQQPTAQQQQQQQQLTQQSKDTMTDLDKIAAQIIGLKQKQQQMQQQITAV